MRFVLFKRLTVLASIAALLGACTGTIHSPLDDAYDAGDAVHPTPPLPPPPPPEPCEDTDVGPTSLRRLTREQYDNLAQDLLAAKFKPSSALPPDEKVGPFASNFQTLPARATIDQYAYVAEQLGAEVASRVQTVAPCTQTSAAGQEACARTFFTTFARRGLRRSVSPSEVDALVALYKSGADGGYAQGIRWGVEAVLEQPSFLYHLELLPQGTSPDAGGAYALAPFEVASRLSFFLWNSGPDDALLEAAANGALLAPGGLAAQVTRMLADVKARRTSHAFADGWLDLAALDAAAASPGRLGGLAPSVVTAMRDETRSFMDEVLRRDDGRLSTLLTAKWTTASASVLALYGSAVGSGERQALRPMERSGVLTHASMLFSHAHAQVTSPVLRGKWVRESLLCQKQPDPPPGVSAVPPVPKPGLSTREQYQEHRANPQCAGCHALLDDVGFGFENYDPQGRYRTQDNGQSVDSTGTLRATDVDGDFVGALGLAAKLSQSDMAHACYARQWLRFGLGREASDADACLSSRLSAVAKSGSYKDLVLELLVSRAFLERRSP